MLPTAAALELIHTYSLIHDDLPAIDDDTLRRGRPTCHVAFGEDVAILAGDGLFAEAFNLVLHAPGRRLRRRARRARRDRRAPPACRAWSAASTWTSPAEAAADDDLRTLHALKTGRLIQAAVVCGALLSGAEDVEPYRAFAAELGLLFQIVDDILDETGAVDELGKSVGKDRALDKVTYVSRFGMERAAQLADEAQSAPATLLGELPGDTSDLAAVARFIHDRRR